MATDNYHIKHNNKSSVRQKLEQATSLESLIRRNQTPDDSHHIKRDIATRTSRHNKNLPKTVLKKRQTPVVGDIKVIKKAWEDPMHKSDGDFQQRIKQRPAVLSKVRDGLTRNNVIDNQNKKLSRLTRILGNVSHLHRSIAPKPEVKGRQIDKNTPTQAQFRGREKVDRKNMKPSTLFTAKKAGGDKFGPIESLKNKKVVKPSITGKINIVKTIPNTSARAVDNSGGTFLTDIPVEDYPSQNEEMITSKFHNINKMKRKLQNNKKVMDDMILQRAESRSAPCHTPSFEGLHVVKGKVPKERSRTAYKESTGHPSHTTGNIQKIIEERKARAAVRSGDAITPPKENDINIKENMMSPTSEKCPESNEKKTDCSSKGQPDKKLILELLKPSVTQCNPARQAQEILNVLSSAETKEKARQSASSSGNRGQSSHSRRNNGENKDRGESEGVDTAASRLIKHAKRLGSHWAAADSFASKYRSLLDDLT